MSSQTLTVPEAARRVGGHVETVRRWIRERKIAATRIKFGQPGYRIAVGEIERIEGEMSPTYLERTS